MQVVDDDLIVLFDFFSILLQVIILISITFGL